MGIMRAFFWALLWGALWIGLAGEAVAPLQAQEAPSRQPPPAILIVDGSGSMWGQIAGRAKISIVKKVLPEVLSTLPPDIRLGVMAYGHRRKSNCRDIELMVPVAPSGRRQQQAIKGILPRGKTPITGALEAAARALRSQGGGGRIILLSDGVENCRRDPCAMARELVRGARDLQIHVVTLGLSPDKAAALQCLPRVSGGLFRVAQGEAELDSALRQVFAALVPKKPAAKPKKPAPPPPPPELQLSATLAPGGPRLAQGVIWHVGPIDAQREALATYRQAAPVLKLSPGTYYVEANYGLARVVSKVTVKPHGPTRINLVLNAGTLVVETRVQNAEAGQEVPVGDGRLVLTVRRKLADGRQMEIDRRTDGAARYRLPAGEYLVTLQTGRVRTQQKVVLAPGAVETLRLAPKIAVLRLSAHGAPEGAALDDVRYQIFAASPSASGMDAGDAASGRGPPRPILRSASKTPAFYLAPGTYRVVATAGRAVTRRKVVLESGRETPLRLVLPSGRLVVKVTTNGVPVADGGLHTRVFALDKDTKDTHAKTAATPIATSHARAPAFRLPVGRYRVEVRAGRVNVMASRVVQIAPGDDVAVTLTLASGLLQTVLRRKAGQAPLRHVFWRLLDERGRELFFTSEPIPRFLLAPGRYWVEAQSRGQSFKKIVNVTVGDQKRLDILSGGRG